MKQSSGLDALLEALKQSGMNVDGSFGGSRAEADDSGSGDGGNAAGGSGSSTGGSSRSRGGFGGFGGFPGFGGFGGFGGGGKGGGSSTEVHNPFADANMPKLSKKAIVILVIVLILVLAAAYWWFHPPINIHSIDTWIFVAIFILLPIFLVFSTKSKNYKTGTKKVEPNKGKAKTFKVLSAIPVVIALVGVIGGVASLSLFPGNAAKHATVLETTTEDFASDIPEVDYSQIPVIDRDSAVLLGDREMGSIPEYVSQFEISPLYSQINYQDAPVRVSPLVYADLFKWFTNRDQGIPAYSLVNMTTQDAEIVRLDDGPIYYSESEPLARNIDRYVQLRYPFYMFDQKSFEIDDEGHPWWICPVQTRTIGLFGGTDIVRVVMVDATTGECTDLPIEEVPQWVDHAYPTDLLIEQYNWSGAYQDGWLNSWLGQRNVVQTTPGSDGMAGYNYLAKDDDVWVYTGVTSATADNSIVGFVLINQRTAESHFYSVSGATEASAMGSAEGQVQNLRYQATFPLLINVGGQPTYFMALKDDAGLVKQFAMLDIQRYQNVAVGDTVAGCQEAYEALLATNGVELQGSAAETAGVKTATGTIVRITDAVMDGNTHFYVQLDGSDEVYDFALPDMLGIVAYEVGDQITFTYIEGDPVSSVQSLGGEETTRDAADEATQDAADAEANAANEPGAATAGSSGGAVEQPQEDQAASGSQQEQAA